MIVGICGTHGTGKSTILKAAKKAGFRIDETQLSRTAQKALGWNSLAPAQESESNMWALQDAIIESMRNRDDAIIDLGEMTVVERTPADVLAYTLLWEDRIRKSGRTIDQARLAEYRQTCQYFASRYAKYIVVEPCAEIPFVEDPNRADLESREFIKSRISEFLWDGMFPTYIIKNTDLKMRAVEVQCVLTLTQVEIKSKEIL